MKLATVRLSFLLVGNQYLMENILIVLAILFAMNSVNLFSILFGNALSGSIKHFVRNESTDELQEPFSPSEIFFFLIIYFLFVLV